MSIAQAPSGCSTPPPQYDGSDRRDDGLYTFREAACYLRVSERKVQAEVAAGRIRKVSFARPGAKKGPVRFRRCDLDAYVAACVVEPVDRRARV
jgi:excisionase family DNA binding protein